MHVQLLAAIIFRYTRDMEIWYGFQPWDSMGNRLFCAVRLRYINVSINCRSLQTAPIKGAKGTFSIKFARQVVCLDKFQVFFHILCSCPCPTYRRKTIGMHIRAVKPFRFLWLTFPRDCQMLCIVHRLVKWASLFHDSRWAIHQGLFRDSTSSRWFARQSFVWKCLDRKKRTWKENSIQQHLKSRSLRKIFSQSSIYHVLSISCCLSLICPWMTRNWKC